MGVKLDWDIEAEKGKLKEHKEDSKQRSTRYLGVFRLFLTVVIFAAILGGIVYLLSKRWEQVNQQIELLLTDTVQAEVAALRLGDLTAFEARQRSATADWVITQRQTFDTYQSLKQTSTVVLSGRIISTEVDGQRARVQIEEIIDGVPYVQTWFYWRYEPEGDNDGGWYHVPPDFTFWGDSAEIDSERYTIRYRDLDTETANLLDSELNRWLDDTCNYFDCATLPFITVDIVPIPSADVQWQGTQEGSWQLIVPSPYTDRARADTPLNIELRIEIASLLAQNLIVHTSNNITPIYASDANYLQQAMTAWLVGRFVQLNSESYLIDSLVNTYGVEVPGTIQRNLQATSDISLIASAAGVSSVADLTVDWRDFVLWRLELEDDLIERGELSTWNTLYDFTDPAVQSAAQQRYQNNFTASSRTVLETSISTSATGTPQLIAQVSVTRGFETGEEIIVFNLINGNWLRAN